MTLPIYFDPKKSSHLFCLSEKFNFLKNLYDKKSLPKILMFSGKKGSGKFTLINHLMFSIFDEDFSTIYTRITLITMAIMIFIFSKKYFFKIF